MLRLHLGRIPLLPRMRFFFFLGDKASENRFWLGDKDLDKIVALLMWMAQNKVYIGKCGQV